MVSLSHNASNKVKNDLEIDVVNISYEIINATKKEEETIYNIIEFINRNYSEKLSLNELKKIEVIDKLPYGSSARSFRNKIILSRKNGLEMVIDSQENIFDGFYCRMLISTIYHELWHISTWKKYEDMYEYITNNVKKDLIIAYAYMYWLEYIAHNETVFLEVPNIMEDFCEKFIRKKWTEMEDGYSYFIKELPYYLIRSQYLNIFDSLTEQIQNKELKSAIYNFDKESKKLLYNSVLNDKEKAEKIAVIIEELLG